ncbi:unnamed protein product [Discosporangium mesarthrocarpum]
MGVSASSPNLAGGGEGTAGRTVGRDEEVLMKLSHLGRDMDPGTSVHQALRDTLVAAGGTVSPAEQLENTRRLIAGMKRINTKDSTGDLLANTQV